MGRIPGLQFSDAGGFGRSRVDASVASRGDAYADHAGSVLRALVHVLIAWGLVALLYPECTVSWTFPGKSGGGRRIFDVDDA